MNLRQYLFPLLCAVFILAALSTPHVITTYEVQTNSMEPEIPVDETLLVLDNSLLYTPDSETVETQVDSNTESFGDTGHVIVFAPNGDENEMPVVHRAILHVEEGEDWYENLNIERVDSCEELNNCPAPHDGFITKGDNNLRYDQEANFTSPVKSEWILGRTVTSAP